MSGRVTHTETNPLEDAMQKPLITPEQAAAGQARAAESLRTLVDYLRTAGASAFAAAGAEMSRSIREAFRPPA